MNLSRTKHSIDAVFAVLLFGLFACMMLLLILFSTQAYQVSSTNLEENQNLHTAMTYVTTKIRQYDNKDAIALDYIDDLPALCLSEEIEGTTYTTYIYLENSHLRELFTVPGAPVSANLGTSIAQLRTFQATWTEHGFLKLYMEDLHGNQEELLLHPGLPITSVSESDVSVEKKEAHL